MLGFEEQPLDIPAKRLFFKKVQKEHHLFTMFPEVKEIVEEEWRKADRNFSVANHFSKLYPFKAEEVNRLEHLPKVDAV